MGLPIVAIVGRPNVGKSSLLNCMVGRRISIVDPTPGVTRDRVSAPCPLETAASNADKKIPPPYVELVDTGGVGMVDSDRLSSHVDEQIQFAIDSAAAVLFLVDSREGVTPLDRVAAERLRGLRRPVILVANKVDQLDMPSQAHEFLSLGFGEALSVSAKHFLGISDLRMRLAEALGDIPAGPPPEPVMKLAVVGKRNAGKSTFINAIAGQRRVIVSEVPGTTRDSVDVRVELDGRSFMLIDTAGIRKRKRMEGDLEYYGLHRALRSIRRADVVVLMIDASVPVSQVDKDLAGEIANQCKPVVLAVNKWDLAAGKADADDFQDYLQKVFPELSFAPICLTTASAGTNVRATLRVAEQLFHQSRSRLGTSELNDMLIQAIQARGPGHKGSRPAKLFYASQIAVCPPTIVCVVNAPAMFDAAYQRYLLGRLRERGHFEEVPARFVFRARSRRAERGKPPKKSK